MALPPTLPNSNPQSITMAGGNNPSDAPIGKLVPPTLPNSNPQSITTAGGNNPSDAPIGKPAFRSFINLVSSSMFHGLSHCRPWSELLNRSSFSRPDNLTEAASRIKKNMSYFGVNYISLIVLVLVVSLLSHPFSLIVLLSILTSWCFLYLFRPSDQPLVIFDRSFSDRETLAILVISTIVVVFLTSVGSLLTSSLFVGLTIVCVHGASRMTEDLFLDDQEHASPGFLSFLVGVASSATSAASAKPTSTPTPTPEIATRV